MSSPSLSGRKRRISDIQTPIRRSKRVKQQSDAVKQVLKRQGQETGKDTKEGKSILLSSPTDVSDSVVMQQGRRVRAKQAKASGLPNFSPSPPEIKVEVDISDTKTEEVETATGEGALTPRPSVHRRTARRPPLSRRIVGLNRARFGVGIVRCRNWRPSEEDTETEDEGPEFSPIEPPSCSCSGPVDEKLEDQVSTFVLPIDPTQTCFDHDDSGDLWQLRSPSPEEELVPEHSCNKVGDNQKRCVCM
ncbi:hypothetical protein P3T76_002877 [Phytophthora citrophthora]|uniref:Uncharacterized protein n=1 Tax=Phytophthora citrophthora TaxID=4793 RepID=A0AAD9GWF3_9STRA|nr:hypothetical protein P3T76_002877 [Phytophthora citrophthora]